MARLALYYGYLREVRRQDLRHRRSLRRITRYTEEAFSCSDEEFIRYYRISKGMFEELVRELTPLMPTPKRRSDIQNKFKVLVALSFFATGSYQRLVGGTQGTYMSQQSVSRALRDVVNALNHQRVYNRHVRFPQTVEERNRIKQRFYEKFHIPSTVGAIDGTHVAIIRPSRDEERYFNRKHYHSRNVLVICDADLNILCVDATFGGASHDNHIWNQNPIKSHLEHLVQVGENVHLLGDSGYAQREYMMTPILDAPPGSAEEYYTKLHVTARNIVERTFGVLKNRWRCLLGHRVLHYSPQKSSKIIYACCVLHNMCNRRGMAAINYELSTEDNRVQQQLVAEPLGTQEEIQRGITARARLVNNLWLSRN